MDLPPGPRAPAAWQTVAWMALVALSSADSKSVESLRSWVWVNTVCALVVARPACVVTC